MSKKVAKTLIALGLLAVTAAAFARDDNWRPATHSSSSPEYLAQTQQQFTPATNAARACTMGSYIRWSCRGDQVCGNTAGSCR
jgi:hypothetical protein